jgi:ubiquinone/menaquinone biosynthesis C-methylase UbiE
MAKNISRQYDAFAETFSVNHSVGENSNNKNRSHFYSLLGDLPFVPKATILDLACGDGLDANHYKENGFEVMGIDASKELVRIARGKYPNIDFKVGLAEKLPYQDECFNAVFSKYAIMTSKDMQPIFTEAHRVLKEGGYFAYLVTHPFRQYFEKKSKEADYFQQEMVTSNILNNSVSVNEPSHTFNEFLSRNFLEKFDIINFEEAFDPAAERVEGRTYPGYFIVVAKKR